MQEEPAVRLRTVVAVEREVPRALDLTGAIRADEESRVTPLVPGRVAEVFVDLGASVSAGDPIARLRDVDHRQAAEAAAAAVGQAQARLGIQEGQEGSFRADTTAEVQAALANSNLAADNLRRMEALAQSGAVSEADLEASRERAAAAREQHAASLNNARSGWFAFQNARAQMAQARRNVTDSMIRAPFDGEIAERHINPGEYLQSQAPVVTLVRLDPVRLGLLVPQENIRDVHGGQRVEVRVDAYPDRVFEGTVRYIGASIDPNTRALRIEAVIPNADKALRPGMFANARLLLGNTERLVELPASAVLSDATTHKVFVVANGRVQERIVAIANRNSDVVMVSGGLRANERVAVEKLRELTDGMRVEDGAGATRG